MHLTRWSQGKVPSTWSRPLVTPICRIHTRIRGKGSAMEAVFDISEDERMGSLEIWIDPSTIGREGSLCGTWLPSPVKSILAPRKSLHMLSARRHCLRRIQPYNAPHQVSSLALIDSVLETEELHRHGSSEITFVRLSTIEEALSKCVQGVHQECLKVYITNDYSPPPPTLRCAKSYSPRRLWQKHLICRRNSEYFSGMHVCVF